MGQICVIRGAGDHQAEDIVEPLLATLDAKLERARVLFNEERGVEKGVEVSSGIFQTGLMPGQTFEPVESTRTSSKTKITRVRHVFIGGDNPSLETLLRAER